MGFRAAAACPGVPGHAVSTAEPPAPRFYNCKFRAGVGAVAAASLCGAGGVVWCGGDSAPAGDRDGGRAEELRGSALDRLRTDEAEPGSEADRYVPETNKGARVWKYFHLRTFRSRWTTPGLGAWRDSLGWRMMGPSGWRVRMICPERGRGTSGGWVGRRVG